MPKPNYLLPANSPYDDSPYDTSIGNDTSIASLFNDTGPQAEIPRFNAADLSGLGLHIPKADGGTNGNPGGGGKGGGPKGGGGGGSGGGGGGGSGGGPGGEPVSPSPFPRAGQGSRPIASEVGGSGGVSSGGPTFGESASSDNAPGPLGTAPTKAPPLSLDPSAEPTKFNLIFSRKTPGGVTRNLCGGTAVGKKPEGDVCSYVFFFAGHCLQGEFSQVQIKKLSDQTTHALTRDALEVEKAAGGNDVALFRFNASCDYLADDEIAKIAPLGPDGAPQLPQGAVLWTRDQDGKLTTGRVNHSIRHSGIGHGNVVADEIAGPHTKGGDSGSPIWSSAGLVGALAGGSQERNDFSFSPTGTRWLVERLSEKGFTTPTTQFQTPVSHAQIAAAQSQARGQTPAGRGLAAMGGNSGVGGAAEASLPGPIVSSTPGVPLPPLVHGAMGNCIACHNRPENKDALPAGVKDPNLIGNHLAAMNDGLLEEMIGRAHLSPDQVHAVKEFVKEARRPHVATSERAVASTVPACFMSKEEQTRKLGEMPELRSGSSQLAAKLSDAVFGGRVMYYDRNSVPRTWQSSPQTASINSNTVTHPQKLLTARNAPNQHMYGEMSYHSDGSREHPWSQPAGMDISPNGSSDKFVIPPASGPMMKFVSRTRRNGSDYFGNSGNLKGPLIGYEYSAGTIFGEVLKVSGVPFEIRLRMKNSSGQWQMDVLRPFESAKDLASGIASLCATESLAGCQTVKEQGLIAKTENAAAPVTSRDRYINAKTFGTRRNPLTLNRTAYEATAQQVALQNLPDLPRDVVEALLRKTPFKSVFNKPWAQGANPGWAPTTNSNFHVVPQNFFGGFVGMNQTSCTKCHDSAGKHVDSVDPYRWQMYASAPGDAERARTWYNQIPGDDGILSFHPYSKEAVERGALTNKSAVNPCLLSNGLAVY